MINAGRLRELLNYDPAAGVFTNKVRRANCVHEGTLAGHVNKKGYRVIKLEGRAYKAHRLAILYVTGVWPPEQVDHKNGVRDDNRFDNLRPADNFINSQNQRHAPAHSTTGLFGAQKGGWKGRRWVSEIRHKGKRYYLGVFGTPEEASAAYIEAKRRLHEGCTL